MYKANRAGGQPFYTGHWTGAIEWLKKGNKCNNS